MSSVYAQMIAEISGYQDECIISEIEEVMRNSIFHSTLDWIEREDFIEGVNQAVEILRMEKTFRDKLADHF